MSATLTEVDYVRVSSDAGEHFVDEFYAALNGARNTIASYYIPGQTLPNGRTLPYISYNGNQVQDARSLQETYEKEMPWSHFEAQSVNAHVLTTALTPVDGKSKRELERNMSIAVQVSGYVRMHERKEGPMCGFSESFVLVPNKEEVGGKGTGKQDHGRRWLVQSQTFRFVT